MIPSSDAFLLPVLRAFAGGEALTKQQTVEHVAEAMGLTADDMAQMTAGRHSTRVASNVEWAIVYLTQAALLERAGRGLRALTDAGRQVLADGPETIDRRYLEKHCPAFAAFRARRRDHTRVRRQAPTLPGMENIDPQRPTLERQLAYVYQALRNLHRGGLDTSHVEGQARRLEDALIARNVAPALLRPVNRAISAIRTPFTLVVKYEPGKPLTLSASRDPQAAEAVPGAVPVDLVNAAITGDIVVATPRQRRPRARMSVTLDDDGTVISQSSAVKTYIATLNALGIERVKDLGMGSARYPLVADAPGKRYHDAGDGRHYVLTAVGTSQMCRTLQRVAKAMGRDLTVSLSD